MVSIFSTCFTPKISGFLVHLSFIFFPNLGSYSPGSHSPRRSEPLDLAGLHQLLQVPQGIVGHTNGLVRRAGDMITCIERWNIYRTHIYIYKYTYTIYTIHIITIIIIIIIIMIIIIVMMIIIVMIMIMWDVWVRMICMMGT